MSFWRSVRWCWPQALTGRLPRRHNPNRGLPTPRRRPRTTPRKASTQPSRLTVFGGQPDASDGSRFLIRYQLNDQEHLIYGKLRDDGTVYAGEKDGPVWSFIK